MGADTSAGTVKDRHERLLAMRAERKLLNDEEVEPAIEDVDNSSLVALLQEFVHLDRGRPRKLTLRTLLIGLYLSTQITGGKVVLELVTDILFFRLSPQMRQRLTVPDYPDHDQGFEAGYAVVRRLFHAMRAAVDPLHSQPTSDSPEKRHSALPQRRT
ncbi:hypothetical protein [Streptomyces sp. NPDC096193]|uniref:hypothetical protein n=1 Tax=Streptomyces sp. NPDC096193 TaxID=3155821 RepID=UPI00332F3D48